MEAEEATQEALAHGYSSETRSAGSLGVVKKKVVCLRLPCPHLYVRRVRVMPWPMASQWSCSGLSVDQAVQV